jgi:hypothetical protein
MPYRIPDRIVTIGGGTGSFTMLSELKKVATHLSAVVTMMDSGGSSRRLMDEFGRPLPLGDLRQALVALSRSSRLWGDLFRYRFPEVLAGVIGGHSLGNLILHALEDLNDGDLLGALEDAEELLNTAAAPPELAARYAAEGAYPVPADVDALRALAPRVLTGPFAAAETLIRHDAERVLLAIWPELAG